MQLITDTAPQTTVRPLGFISDAVRNELPNFGDVDRLRNDPQYKRSAEEFLADHLQACQSLEGILDPVSILDLKMLYVLASVARIERLARDYEKVVRAQIKVAGYPDIAHILYEEIVFRNPKNDVRAFTTGDTGESEKKFYMGHVGFEEQFGAAVYWFESARETHSADELLSACTCIARTPGLMANFNADLDPSHFAAFKPFFDPNPYTKEKGPSGAFSINVPLVDIHLLGPSMGRTHYLQTNAAYFPVKGYKNLMAMMSQPEWRPLEKIFDGDSWASEYINIIKEKMRYFRQEHIKTVRRQIGTKVRGSAEGDNAHALLEERMGKGKLAGLVP